MGQKVHPFGLRLGIIQDWRSRWFAPGAKFAEHLEKDIQIRRYLYDRLSRAGIARVEIERADKSLSIAIHTARPGIVIGKGGIEVDQIRQDIEKIADTKDVQIAVLEVRFPELDASLVAQNVAEQLIARVPFRRAMKRAVSAAIKTGAKGIKVMVSGRLGGHEMSRTEWYREGRVPLHTLKADIDYGYIAAKTTFGTLGVKVWIYKGERRGKRPEVEEEPLGLTKPKGKRPQVKKEPLGLVEPKRKPVEESEVQSPADGEALAGKPKSEVEEKKESDSASSSAKASDDKEATPDKEKPKIEERPKETKAEEKEKIEEKTAKDKKAKPKKEAKKEAESDSAEATADKEAKKDGSDTKKGKTPKSS